jgi:hypothetical protein
MVLVQFTQRRFIMELQNEKKRRFQIEQLEDRIAPAIVLVNPAGKEPPGWNK